MDKILNCPFCGGKAFVSSPKYEPERCVSCENPGCPVEPATDYYDTAEEAIAAWNTRADGWHDATPDQKRIQQLESIIYNTLWMARRYAHDRATVAPSQVNHATALALELGLDIRGDKGTVWAKDRDFGWPTELIQKYGRHDVKEEEQ